nr:ParA family protein [uncultured Mucilaginibacter sp.]
MSIINRYGIWNNKGGVGKSTITFHLATRYAELNPDKNVLVIDLCPQANSSMMLLGGGTAGETNVINLCTATTPQTVVGYLSSVIAGGPGGALPNPDSFTVQVNSQNSNLTENLYLLCGDGNLEPISPAIINAANAPALIPSIQPWVWIHNIFRAFADDFARIHDDKDLMIFIDTNPAFGIYTELAITASDKLLCPINADDSSRTASNAMAILLHGTTPPHPIYGAWTFATKASQFNSNVPKIHLLIGNRLTQFDGAATAFNALSDASAETLYNIYRSNPGYFTTPSNHINNIHDFKDNYSALLRDFNTAGVVTSHLGSRLSLMRANYYYVHGQRVQLNRERIAECLDAVDAIINRI